VNVLEDHLEACSSAGDPIDLFLDGSFGDRESCQLYLTYLRATGELTNYLYSFFSSRTQFYVHQFKPLVKLLDNFVRFEADGSFACGPQVYPPPGGRTMM